MKIFITGATGYIGGSVAAKLIAGGHHVRGLVRSQDKAVQIKARGVEPVLGTLADFALITQAARDADAVMNTANADDFAVADVLLKALVGSGKPLIHTGGTSVMSDRAAGEYSDAVFHHEDIPIDPLPERMLRVAVDRMVLKAAQSGIRTVVVRPSMIYGRGRGLKPHSTQVPHLIELAKEHGVARHVGRGLNVWSHVHIDDVVDLYLLALADAQAGSLYNLGHGEAVWKDIAAAIGRMLGLGDKTEDWPIEEAARAWGPGAITSYGSNCRVRSWKAYKMLGWAPKGRPLFEEIEHGCYREDFGPRG